MKLNLTPPELSIRGPRGHERYSVSCEAPEQGVRYHAWLETETLAIESARRIGGSNHDPVQTVYKNPIENATSGRSRTIYLTADRGEGKIVAAHMLADLESLRAVALTKAAAVQAEEDRKHKAAVRANRIDAEAQTMFDIVLEIIRCDGNYASLLDKANAIHARVEAEIKLFGAKL